MKTIVTILAALTVAAAAETTPANPAIASAVKNAQTEIANATSPTAGKASAALEAAKALSQRIGKAAAPVVAAVKVEAEKAKTTAQAEAPAIVEKVSAVQVAQQSVAQQLLGAAARVADSLSQEKH